MITRALRLQEVATAHWLSNACWTPDARQRRPDPLIQTPEAELETHSFKRGRRTRNPASRFLSQHTNRRRRLHLQDLCANSSQAGLGLELGEHFRHRQGSLSRGLDSRLKGRDQQSVGSKAAHAEGDECLFVAHKLNHVDRKDPVEWTLVRGKASIVPVMSLSLLPRTARELRRRAWLIMTSEWSTPTASPPSFRNSRQALSAMPGPQPTSRTRSPGEEREQIDSPTTTFDVQGAMREYEANDLADQAVRPGELTQDVRQESFSQQGRLAFSAHRGGRIADSPQHSCSALPSRERGRERA